MEDMYTHIHNNNPHEIQNKIDCRTGRTERQQCPYCLVISITGQIQTWSVILKRNCRTKEQIEARLRSFKDRVKLKKHSVGFIFASRNREILQDEKNMESNIFKTLFPKLPFVGCIGSGEFGKNTTPVDKMDEESEYFLYF